MNELRNRFFRRNIFLLLLPALFFLVQCKEPASLSALIISDGGSEVNDGLKTILENSGLFDADIAKNNAANYSSYDVVVLNLSNAEWDEETSKKFADYVSAGGGVVALANSAYAFRENGELSKLFGLSDRTMADKSAEPYSFKLVNTKEENPVTNGLNESWMHADDYLFFGTETLTGETEVLATAWADTLQGGNGAHLPVLYTTTSGDGKVFISTLGMSAGNDDLTSIQCVGFISTFQRGAEWAATGIVSQDVSVDFPNSVSVHSWEDYRPLDIDELFNRSMNYEVGKSKKYLNDISMRIRNSDGKAQTYAAFEEQILDYLSSDASVDSKRYFCRELSWIGSEKSVAVLEKLVNDKDLSESASYALQRLRM